MAARKSTGSKAKGKGPTSKPKKPSGSWEEADEEAWATHDRRPTQAAPDAPVTFQPSEPTWQVAPEPTYSSAAEEVLVAAPFPTESAEPVQTEAPALAAATIVWEVRGLAWVATAGWALFFVALYLPTYMYAWALDNGTDYRVAGVNGTYLAALVALLGLALGIVFTFQPRRASPWSPSVPSDWITQRAAALRARARILTVATIAGLAIAALGLLLAAYAGLLQIRAGAGEPVVLLGYSNAGSAWTGYGLGTAGLGLVVAAISYARCRAARETILAALVLASRPAHASGAGGGVPDDLALPPGTTRAHVEALMHRIDGLLATLPDEIVTEFSKSPEADTYLKLLSGKPPPT